jgi:hypothetical protein
MGSSDDPIPNVESSKSIEEPLLVQQLKLLQERFEERLDRIEKHLYLSDIDLDKAYGGTDD